MAISLTSCGQQKEDKQNDKSSNKSSNNPSSMVKYDINNYIFPEAREITAKNFAEKTVAQIKDYSQKPRYYFRINKQNCFIRIYINDVNIYDDYRVSNYITPIAIDHILTSGKQKVTIKMFPVGNANNEDFGINDAPPMTKLTAGSQVAVSVISIDEKSNKNLDDEKLVAEKTSPKEAEGKETYTFSFTFKATVPYNFEGWTKGQDLRKLDQQLVKKKAMEFYKMVESIYLNKDLDAKLKLDYPSTVRIWASSFGKKQDVEDLLSEYNNQLTKRDYTALPIKNFEMEYMGDGKLVRLITDNEHPSLRGGGALLLQYGTGENTRIHQPGITLYLPEGRSLEQGFMMWK